MLLDAFRLVCFFLSGFVFRLLFSTVVIILAPRRAAILISTSTPLTLASQLVTWLYFYSILFPFCMHVSLAMRRRCTLLWHPGRRPWTWAGLYVDVIPLLLSSFFISLNMSTLYLASKIMGPMKMIHYSSEFLRRMLAAICLQ